MFKLKPLDKPVPEVDAPGCGSPDEDGDCIADDVDNCPGIANANQDAISEPDTLRGAGDVCDPDSAVVGHAVKRFTGFGVPDAERPQWEPVQTWHFDEGQLTKFVMSNGGAVKFLEVDDDDDLTVEASFVFHAWDMMAADVRLGILIDSPIGSEGGETCWLAPLLWRVYVQERTEDSTQSNNAKAVDIPPVPEGAHVTLQFRRERAAGRVHCIATIDGATSDVSTVASGPWLTGQHIGLQAKNLLADALYVTVYAR